jgi:hypothetical protein
MFGNNAASTVLIQRFSRTGGSRASLSSALELIKQYTGLPSKSPHFWTGFNALSVDSSSRVTAALPGTNETSSRRKKKSNSR